MRSTIREYRAISSLLPLRLLPNCLRDDAALPKSSFFLRPLLGEKALKEEAFGSLTVVVDATDRMEALDFCSSCQASIILRLSRMLWALEGGFSGVTVIVVVVSLMLWKDCCGTVANDESSVSCDMRGESGSSCCGV